MAAAVDDLSEGRLVLGLGAGWQEREHQMFGFDLLPLKNRFDRFEEGVEVVRLLLQQTGPQSYMGKYYQLREAELLPKPHRPAGPPILIGGNGKGRTLLLAARAADEWNGIFMLPHQFRELDQLLDARVLAAGRKPAEVRRSLMTGLVFGAEDRSLKRNLAARGNVSIIDLQQRGIIVGTPNAVIDQISALAQAGVQGIMLQWLDLDDLTGLEALGRSIIGKM
jgi:alkanesulfonate monooxygenase SsuD/methylene tetrahydromethanopterin reductase-like flavin-dependent oxidoreductase (luciferase family)